MPPKKYYKLTNSNFLLKELDAYNKRRAFKTARGWIIDGIKNSFSKDCELDTDKTRLLIDRMKHELTHNKVNKKNPIFKEISELNKTLNVVDYLHKNKIYYEEDYQIQRAINIYKKVKAKYKKLMK